MFTALAENFGEMEEKINFFVAIAPVTKLRGDSTELFDTLSMISPYLLSIFE